MKAASVFYCFLGFFYLVHAQRRGYQEAMFLFTKSYTSFGYHSGIIKVPVESTIFEFSPYFKELHFHLYDNYVKLIALKAILRAATTAKATGDILYLYNYIALNGLLDNMSLNYKSNFKQEVCYYLNSPDALSIHELEASATDRLLSKFYSEFPVQDCQRILKQEKVASDDMKVKL